MDVYSSRRRLWRSQTTDKFTGILFSASSSPSLILPCRSHPHKTLRSSSYERSHAATQHTLQPHTLYSPRGTVDIVVVLHMVLYLKAYGNNKKRYPRLLRRLERA